ncbi:hypothetical protein SMD44_08399 [Streptomyces alboflavus]|uniref:Uncharacterized protein n=1 Tax=Streptomyces alboflavus TaxID=67267 RepID=A0A1Z1WRG1_9ACTN|nr:hypothetical protein [Streptomyces alboflavus]ARX88912.1 hypothetical protein SMD44_08399 [Streptomyces alboflavus]
MNIRSRSKSSRRSRTTGASWVTVQAGARRTTSRTRKSAGSGSSASARLRARSVSRLPMKTAPALWPTTVTLGRLPEARSWLKRSRK